MNLRHWKRWEKLRKNGKINFVLVNGGLIGGSLLAIMVTLLHQLIEPVDYWEVRLLVYIFIFSFVGMLAAIYIWNNAETKFLSENPPKHRRITSSH
jgi:hypothetical protein